VKGIINTKLIKLLTKDEIINWVNFINQANLGLPYENTNSEIYYIQHIRKTKLTTIV
jgi:hypothetical protein